MAHALSTWPRLLQCRTSYTHQEDSCHRRTPKPQRSIQQGGVGLVGLVAAVPQVVKQLGSRGERGAADPTSPPLVKALDFLQVRFGGQEGRHQRCAAARRGGAAQGAACRMLWHAAITDQHAASAWNIRNKLHPNSDAPKPSPVCAVRLAGAARCFGQRSQREQDGPFIHRPQ